MEQRVSWTSWILQDNILNSKCCFLYGFLAPSTDASTASDQRDWPPLLPCKWCRAFSMSLRVGSWRSAKPNTSKSCMGDGTLVKIGEFAALGSCRNASVCGTIHGRNLKHAGVVVCV